MNNRKLYQAIASAVLARENCIASNNTTWEANHKRAVDSLTYKYFPSGSGLDQGVKINWEKTTADHLVFSTAFHHMDDAGGYDGWTDHDVIVTASLVFGIDVRVTGRNRNDIKDYIGETVQYHLLQDGISDGGNGWKPIEEVNQLKSANEKTQEEVG